LARVVKEYGITLTEARQLRLYELNTLVEAIDANDKRAARSDRNQRST
tara:strand:+ start:3697 stop:3840 length:144 start_codon:yes stop_codon:yes gene_type:complete